MTDEELASRFRDIGETLSHLGSDVGEIKGRIRSINGLPCVQHGEAIATVKVQLDEHRASHQRAAWRVGFVVGICAATPSVVLLVIDLLHRGM